MRSPNMARIALAQAVLFLWVAVPASAQMAIGDDALEPVILVATSSEPTST